MSDKIAVPHQAGAAEARRWPKLLAAYREPDEWRSVFEILVTALPFLGFWIAMWWLVASGHWWIALFLAVPAAGFLVRLFMIQHDCGHDAFFRRRGVNDWVGRVIGVVTFTPYDYWRRTHAVHHAGSGNLDQRGMGDVTTLTVEEYRARSRWQRFGYRVYRHPLVLFGVGPAYLFLLQYRLPIGLMRGGWRPWGRWRRGSRTRCGTRWGRSGCTRGCWKRTWATGRRSGRSRGRSCRRCWAWTGWWGMF